MSWNISRFKVKLIRDLKIPVDRLFTYEKEDWHPKRINKDDGSVEFLLSCAGGLSGTIDESGFLNVTDVECSDEGSGGSWEYVMNEAFKQSTGYFEAVIIWESGEDIERYIVNEGKITRKCIEL